LNSKKPHLIGFELSSEQMDELISRGDDLNKMAVENAKKVDKHFVKHLDKVFFTDNYRTTYEYHGEVRSFDFQNSRCTDEEGKEHLCRITLKSSSEFIDKANVDLFDPNVSDNSLAKHKQILTSEAILKYLIFYGMPANNEELLHILKEDFHSKYSENEKFSDNIVRENIKRMLSVWHEIQR
jgi:hypothetical protein